MSKIKGKAKKFDGTAVDYVLLFDWVTGNCIGKSVPDVAGNWVYNHTSDLNVGITYVADGCEPITHGAYNFIAVATDDPILHYSFNGDAIDLSENNLNGVKTGDVTYSAGRKTGTQCADFTNGCIRTSNVLPINGGKVSVSFWIDFRSLSDCLMLMSLIA